MDSSVQVAFLGMVGIFATAASVVIVAVVNSRKERGDTAENAVEMTLRERLTLRDEQIKDHLDDKVRLKEQLAEKALENDELTHTVAEQGVLIAQYVETIARLAEENEAGAS